MRKHALIKFVVCCLAWASCSLGTSSAQTVITYAGTLNVSGTLDGPAPFAQFNNPHGIAVDPEGIVYVADRFNYIIRKIDLDGNVTTLAGKAGIKGDTDGQGENALFNEPWGICYGTDNNIYVADTRNNKIRKVTLDGTVTTYAGSGIYGVANGSSGLASFGNPTGIEMDATGNLYVADHLTHIIRKINTNGQVSTIAGSPYLSGAADGQGTNARFWRPYGLTLDQNGNILVADEWNHRIRRITPGGLVTTVAGTGIIGYLNGTAVNATFNYPWDITVDAVGNIFVADGYNYLIRKITPAGAVTTYAGKVQTSGGVDGYGTEATFSGATSIDYNTAQNTFFVGDAYNHLIRKIVPQVSGTVVCGIQNTLNSEGALCVGETVMLDADPQSFEEYRFFVNDTLRQQSVNPTFSYKVQNAGNYVFRVEGFTNPFTVVSDNRVLKVNPNPEPVITTSNETTFFQGDSVTLIASNGAAYLWSTGATTQTIIVKEQGQYSVKVTNDGGCAGTSEKTSITVIPVSPAPVVVIDGPSVLCPGTSTQLVSTYADGNQWLKNGFPITGATERTLQVNAPGAYQVQVLDGQGIILNSSVVEVTQSNFQIVTMTADKTAPFVDEAVKFSATYTDTPQMMIWDFGDNDQLNTDPAYHAYSEEGIFSVRLIAKSDDGCLDTLQKAAWIKVRKEGAVIPEDSDIFIPTAFTPNFDGYNDIFTARGGNLSEFSMQIFNHWGEMVFTTTDLANGWDGFCAGQPAQPATYTYVIDVYTEKGRRLLTGKVTLVR